MGRLESKENSKISRHKYHQEVDNTKREPNERGDIHVDWVVMDGHTERLSTGRTWCDLVPDFRLPRRLRDVNEPDKKHTFERNMARAFDVLKGLSESSMYQAMYRWLTSRSLR